MKISEQINEDLKKAMLNKEKDKLTALRSAKSAFLLAKTESSNKEISDDKELQIIQKLVKQRKDSATIYKEQNREDLYTQEIFEAEVLSKYLPQQMSEEEIEKEIKEIIEQTGASDIKDMGKVMGAASKKLAGKADNKTISMVVKKVLQS